MLSKQTPNSTAFFAYCPLSGADVALFPTDRPADMPRVFIIRTSQADPYTGVACGGRVQLTVCPETMQITCVVNGKRTERFSIVYPNKRKRKNFMRA